MPHPLPDYATFERLATGTCATERRLVPLYRRLFADALTPVLAYRRLVRPDPRMAPSFLFESVVGGERIARYSFLGAQPVAEIVARAHKITYTDHRDPAASKSCHSDDPLATMAELSRGRKLTELPRRRAGRELPDFTGGWVGYAGYDSVRYLERDKLGFEHAPDLPPDDRGLPDLHFQLYNDVIAFDHVQKTVLVITHVQPTDHDSPRAAYDAGCARLDELVARLTTPTHHHYQRTADSVSVTSASANRQLTAASASSELTIGDAELDTPPPPLSVSNMGEGGYQQAVRRCREYIAAGDCFQVVPSQRFERQTTADPFDIYRALRVVNPSPYMFYLQAQGAILVGSSPEILVRVEEDKVTSRPLAGTRRRGGDAAEDAALEQDLRTDAKEVAEHVMLVDLGRNDVGRVARPGSVELPAVLEVERFSHVMHLSSTVTGRLREGLTAWDALRATLPVGTVSGAPKVRAMQIIDELEPTRRGPYAGGVGYADFAGNMDIALALRTMVITREEAEPDAASDSPWTVHIQAGGGIVADSDPEAEHEETVNKAAALAKAVDLAELAFTRE